VLSSIAGPMEDVTVLVRIVKTHAPSDLEAHFHTLATPENDSQSIAALDALEFQFNTE